MRIQFGTLLADIGFINLPKNYQVCFFDSIDLHDCYSIWSSICFVLLILQIGAKKKENLDMWFSNYSQPFNRHSHHSAVVKVIINIFAHFVSIAFELILFWCHFCSFAYVLCYGRGHVFVVNHFICLDDMSSIQNFMNNFCPLWTDYGLLVSFILYLFHLNIFNLWWGYYMFSYAYIFVPIDVISSLQVCVRASLY